ncbi:hypothetical protein KX729_09200 [Rhizobium sp. XQZ8]|uniref:DEAD/DEAH box helicase family protein n=1 Tax=Rhizobium populisoli TaxID=2859785 RepID=UPI001CA5838B|nr:DEAD/DEAH box helicase family protein [Rhizobium populisoli]MBW6421615.1 hypothetical protein [Rhizobium populisoli]
MALTQQQQAEQDAFIALVGEWHKDIAFFANNVFQVELTPKQIEFAKAFQSSRQITFRGGVGFGKTMAMSIIVWWSLVTHDEVQVTIFGPTEGQLKGGIWKELTSLYGKMDKALADGFEMTATRISRKTRSSDCFAEFRLANKDNIAATRGIHKRNNFVLVDEATGIEREVFTDSLVNILTDPNPKLCLVSNPNKLDSYFFDTFYGDISADWTKVHGAMIDGRQMTQEKVDRIAIQYGGKTAPRYRALVLGEFPLSDEDSLIPREFVEEAIDNEDAIPATGSPIIWGLDPAGKGADRSVLCVRQDNKVIKFHEWRNLDPAQLATQVLDLWKLTPAKDRPNQICVDAIGLGNGVAAVLKQWNLPVLAVTVSNKPTRKQDLYTRLRDQLWWECREWLMDGNRCIPNNPDLIRELCTPTYEEFPKIKVEDKPSIKRRLGMSPDLADAMCLTFAGNSQRFSGRWAWSNTIQPSDLRAFE